MAQDLRDGCPKCDNIKATGDASGKCHTHADGSWSCGGPHTGGGSGWTGPEASTSMIQDRHNAFEVLRGGAGSAGDPYHVFAGFPYAPNTCVFCELPRGNHVAVNMSHSEANARDAARYRRLRVLGARLYSVPYTRDSPLSGLLCFTNLDAAVDADIAAHPSRGEAKEG